MLGFEEALSRTRKQFTLLMFERRWGRYGSLLLWGVKSNLHHVLSAHLLQHLSVLILAALELPVGVITDNFVDI